MVIKNDKTADEVFSTSKGEDVARNVLQQFATGDVVRLKSGGPLMTVAGGHDDVSVYWHDTAGRMQTAQLQLADFTLRELNDLTIGEVYGGVTVCTDYLFGSSSERSEAFRGLPPDDQRRCLDEAAKRIDEWLSAASKTGEPKP